MHPAGPTAKPTACRSLWCARRQLFGGDRRVEVITGDAATIIAERGPFDLIFADCGVRDENSLLVGTKI